MRVQAKLVQTLFGDLIDAILRIEDISAADSNVLQSLFKELLQRIERLFMLEKTSEIAHFCDDSYMRFRCVVGGFFSNAERVLAESFWCCSEAVCRMWLIVGPMGRDLWRRILAPRM